MNFGIIFVIIGLINYRVFNSFFVFSLLINNFINRDVKNFLNISKRMLYMVSDLNKFEDGAVVDAASLIEMGIISKAFDGVKVLGNGELTKKITVKAAKFTASAASKIEAAGGKAEVM